LANRTQAEQDLLALLQQERHRNASRQEPELPDLPLELFGNVLPAEKRQVTAALSGDAYLNFLGATQPAPAPNPTDLDLSALWSSSPASVQAHEENELEGLWSTAEPTASGEAPDALSGLFMNQEAVAQAEMSGQAVDFSPQELGGFRRQASSRGGFEVEFDGDFDMNAPAPPRTGRFRIDQPPPRPTFNRSVSATDGQVVSQRGADGRFRTAAVQTRHVAPGEVIRPPPLTPTRQQPELPRSTTTKYDVLRKGGLDL
jgi:hypothetical protein